MAVSRVWTYRTRAVHAADEAEARALLTAEALRDVPAASVDVLSVRRTPTGRYSALMRRVRCPWSDADECAMARERSVAGASNVIPACPVHGAHPDMIAS